MNIRHPTQAGAFYEAASSSCRLHAQKLLEAARLPDDLPQALYGGIVPHAGWIYSGALAAMTLKALAAREAPATFVLLGADHRGAVRGAEVFDSGVWWTPLGEVRVDEELAAAALELGPPFRANPAAHAHEHSLEVQVPLIQVLCPQAKIVPIAVPPTRSAVEIGQKLGTLLKNRFPQATLVASTDLTHHGGHFPAPGGRGEKGVRWTEENDRRMIALMETLAAEKVLPECEERQNACGAGAVAAALAACRQRGASRGILLDYTNSYRVIHKLYSYELDDTTVGYASVVFA